MRTTEFEEQLRQRCTPLDERLCDIKKSDAVMKEFQDKRDLLGTEMWSNCAKLMVDGYKNQLLQAIVLIEDIKSFILAEGRGAEKTELLDQLDDWLTQYRGEYERNKKIMDMVKQLERSYERT
ncbi:MAG: hypothetical protein J6Q22_07980 [Prevotella sp.]|nr:hypothetical protein [Prevotella sp.]